MQYSWFIWSLILLIIWAVLYFTLKDKESKREMVIVSLSTSLLGLTEPIFVPLYWSPPSLFDLALKTGFDVESFIFSFGIGGVAVVLYEKIFHTKHDRVSKEERKHKRHRFHYFALLSAPVLFLALYFTTNLNPIYSVIISLTLGGFFTWYCRPDLKKKMIVTAFLFTAIYYVYFVTLILFFPNYVDAVWNLEEISGIFITGIPIEELMFAASFGFIWSSIYEHLYWRKVVE